MVSFLSPCVLQLVSKVMRLDISPSTPLSPQGQPTPTSVITDLHHQRQSSPLVNAPSRLLPTMSADTTKATEVNRACSRVQLPRVACQSISLWCSGTGQWISSHEIGCDKALGLLVPRCLWAPWGRSHLCGRSYHGHAQEWKTCVPHANS